MESLGSKILQSLKWSYAATAIIALLQIVVTAVLARLLSPSDYGLVALSYLVISFGVYIAQLGLGPALIQKSELTNQDIATAYVTSVALGIFFFVATCLTAPLIAKAFGANEAKPIIQLMSISFILSSVGTISVNLLRRQLAFRSLSLIELSAFVIGSGLVTIPLALFGFGVWSLVIGQLINATIISIFATKLVAPRTFSGFDYQSFRALFAFGGKHSLTSMLQFFSYNVWVFFVSKFYGTQSVGLYSRASLLIQLPTEYISNTVQRIGFPSLSQIQNDPERMRRAYFGGSLLLAVGLFPFCFSVSAAAHEIVLVILGSQWIESIKILKILAIAAPFHMMLSFHGIVLDVKNRLSLKILIQICHFILICSLYALLGNFELAGIALAFLLIEFAFYVTYSIVIYQILGYRLSDIWQWHKALILPIILTAGPPAVIATTLPSFGTPVLATLAAEVFLGLSGYLISLSFLSTIAFRSQIEKLLSLNEATLRPETFIGRLLGWYRATLYKIGTN